ncbi:MAG TPA: VCBS repeat-containing protein [Acidimicrobiales bacterium]|nr:VCBS repeat-containing protein [Acidimicrobiales bacterium]
MRRVALILTASLLATAVVVAQAPPAAAAQRTIATGTGDGAAHRVRSFDSNGALVSDSSSTGTGSPPRGVRVAVGDVDGDGNEEVITAGGPGGPSSVTVFPGTASFPFASFSPYGDFTGGVNIAAGDVDGDGRDEIVTAADSGGGPHVRVWDVDGQTQIREKLGWFAYNPGFTGGVSVAVAQLVGSNRAEVVTGAGPGGGPHVRIFDVSGGSARDAGGWFAYAPGFNGGVNVAAGSLDGAATVVTGAGVGGGPHVRAFTPAGAERTGLFAYAPGFGGGVNVAVGDADNDGRGEIVTAPASGGGPHVRTFEGDGAASKPEFFAYEPNMTAGVHVALFRTAGSQNSGSSSNTGGNP